MKHHATLLSICAIALCGVPVLAHADATEASAARFSQPPDGFAQPDPPPASPYREGKGWFIGGDLGMGSATYGWDDGRDDGSTAAFFQVRLGGMLTPRIALSAEYWSDGHNVDDGTAYTQNVMALGLRYWMIPRLWIGTGLGSATLKHYRTGNVDRELEGVTFMVGVGYEVLSRERYALDLTMRLITTSYDDITGPLQRSNFALGVGFNWY